jgi:hypothetical protein
MEYEEGKSRDEDYVQDILEEFDSLKRTEERINKEEVWQEINDNVVPNRSGFLQDDTTNTRGERRGQSITDGGPMMVLKTYQSGIMGQLLSQYLKFFSVYFPDEDMMANREVRIWTGKVDQILYGLILTSNFFPTMYEFFGDAGSIGTATPYRYWDDANRREVFLLMHPREIYIAENEHDEVDTVYRYTLMTAKKLIQSFGEDVVHPDVVKAYNTAGGKYTEYKCVHAVHPNPDYDPRKKDNKSKKYLSCYIDVDHNKELRSGGYNAMPYAPWRVEKEPDEVYGRGPGWRALADIKALYAYVRSDVNAAQQLVNPTLGIPEELKGKVNWVPGGRYFYEDANRLVREPQNRIELRAGLEREDRKQRLIEAHFFVPYFMKMQRLMDASGNRRTAYEVQRIEEEAAINLGPHLTGLPIVMDALLGGVFQDAWENGMIPPPPRILMDSGQKLSIKYIGPLALAQRRYFETEPYRKALENIGAMLAMDPSGRTASILDNYDFDKISREMAKANGLPEEAMLDEKAVAKMRQARAKQMQEQQQMAAMETMGKAAPGLNQQVQAGSMLENMGKAAKGGQ